MKIVKTMMAAAVFAAASFGSSAYAADISQSPMALSLIDESAFFGATFGAGNNGNMFDDHFTFSVTGAPAVFDGLVASISPSFDITGLSLYTSTGTLVTAGTVGSSGAVDLWTVPSAFLAAGDYYLSVQGSISGNTGTSFAGTVQLAPVPEPETYGMMIAGLGVMGFLARRRKSSK